MHHQLWEREECEPLKPITVKNLQHYNSIHNPRNRCVDVRHSMVTKVKGNKKDGRGRENHGKKREFGCKHLAYVAKWCGKERETWGSKDKRERRIVVELSYHFEGGIGP